MLQDLFEAENADCLAIDAYPVAEDRLFVAVEAIDKKRAASAILAVTLGKQPTFEVLHASPRSAHDYVYDDSSDTHVLLQGGGVLRLRAGVETFTPYEQPLHRIAVAGDVVVACGGTEVVAIAEDGTLSKVPIDTQFGLHAIAALGERVYAGSRSGTLFVGDCHGLRPVARADGESKGNLDILSLHPTPEGIVLIGGRDGVARFADGVVTRLELDPYATWGRAVCVDGGDELYAVEHWRSDEVVLHRRDGTALSPVAKTKFKAIRSRRLPHASTRMHARGGLLVVSINDAVHIRTGETWRKLKIAPTAALVAFNPATMKPVAALDLPRPSASPVGAAYDQPRGDGLYAARDVSGWNIVRFVGDRTVLTTSTMPEEKLKNVLKWLKPGKHDKPVPVELTKDRVKWSDGAIAYDGTWSGEQLELAVESSNGYRATRRYDFYAEEQLLASKSAK
ncbi:MAG: hypothetical protein AB7T06_43645 [Kofleriaceae bacterium]